jgi:hypothetical protein
MDNVNAGDYYFTIPAQRLFYESSAGTYTYYMIAAKITGDYASIRSRQMDLIFIPTAYGSKDGVISINPEDRVYTIPSENYIETEHVNAIQRERGISGPSAGSDADALVKRIETLTAKVEALENRLETVENR